MKIIRFDDKVETIYNVSTFPYNKYKSINLKLNRKNGGGRKSNPYYIEMLNAFDIETTSYKPLEVGFMYLWGMCVNDTEVIIGRTWEEFTQFINKLVEMFGTNARKRLVVYSHYLPFEFQFMQNFFNFIDVFARDKRVVIKAVTDSGIEFRCSYALTNMSLDKFTRKTKGVEHIKKSGEKFDYSKMRLPNTPLYDDEIGYQFCDVKGLTEALKIKMESDGDNLATVPITSTGYVRRDFRKEVLSNEDNFFKLQETKLRPFMYALCKTATRGGNCHCNTIYSDEILTNVTSFDKKSSYPFSMAVDKFPITKFCRKLPNQFESVVKNYACLIDITFKNIVVKDMLTIPYIPKAKCTGISKGRYDNGRVIKADLLSMVITDIDYNIIERTYDFEDMEIRYLYTSEYGLLNYEFRRHLIDMFQIKTELESGDRYIYEKYKNKINSAFGMMLTDIAQEHVLYKTDGELWKVESPDLQTALNRYYRSRNSFLSYQHGIWVTANARRNLQDSLYITGSDTVYIDTDSNKHIGDYSNEFEELNNNIIEQCEQITDVTPWAEVDGKRTYLGVWELDGKYSKFKSLGAKKYCYIKEGKDELEITVAGLSKDKGAKYLNENGGINSFRNGFCIPQGYSGRTTSKYNDDTEIYKLTINDCTFTTSSNVYIEETEYTFGQTEEYKDYIMEVKTAKKKI